MAGWDEKERTGGDKKRGDRSGRKSGLDWKAIRSQWRPSLGLMFIGRRIGGAGFVGLSESTLHRQRSELFRDWKAICAVLRGSLKF